MRLLTRSLPSVRSTWTQCSRCHFRSIGGNMRELMAAAMAGAAALLVSVAILLLQQRHRSGLRMNSIEFRRFVLPAHYSLLEGLCVCVCLCAYVNNFSVASTGILQPQQPCLEIRCLFRNEVTWGLHPRQKKKWYS